MSRRNRLFAILLALTMTIAYMPSPVFSAADESAGSPEGVAGSGDIAMAEGEEAEVTDGAGTAAEPVEEVKGEEPSDAVETVPEAEDTKVEESAPAEEDLDEPVPEEEMPPIKNKASTNPAEADSTPEFNVQGSKKASPTTLGKDRKTTVTLEMPSGEYQNKIDIVFVMDNSTSVANSGFNFADNVESLFGSIIENNPGIDMKVAVVKFRGYATDMLDHMTDEYSGLTVYDDSSKASIMAAISNNSVPGSGSNAHSGLRMADKLLEADSDVEDSNKYVVFLTDGKNYIWNNDKDEPVTYYSQYAERTSVKNSGKPTMGQKTGNYNKEQGKVYCTVPQITDHEPVNFVDEEYKPNPSTSAYYSRLFNSTNSELSSTDTKYDFAAYYSKYYDSYTGNATVGDGTVTKRTLTNGASIFNVNGQQPWRDYYDYVPAAGTFWEDVNYLQLNPYEVVKNEDGTYSYDTDKVNEDFFLWHPDAFQKGVYQAGHYWKDEIVAKYNAASVSFDPNGGGGLNLAGSFHHWLLETSDFGADVKDSDSVSAMFTDIDNSIRYMVGSGVVTDKIADEFTLVKPSGGASPFKMTHDGQALSSSSAGDNKWNFGTATDGVYPYVAEYDESSKTITWTINVPIENLKKITLSYDLVLGEEYPSGTYDTNESAVLVYTSSDGKYKDQEYTFEKPKVKYKEETDYTLTINYVYAGGGTAAKSYKATLKAGASYGPIKSPTITGYKPDKASVSGVMPEGNVTIKVVYSEIPDDDDDDDDNPGGGNPGGGNPGGPPAPPAGPTAGTTVPDTPAPQAAPPTTTITDPEPPLAAGAWALINLICAILTALGAIIALFRRKEEEDEDEEENQNAYKAEDEEEEEDDRGRKMLAAKLAGALAGIAAPIVFLLTEDMTLPMQLIDKWTLIMVIILAAQIVAAVFNKKASELDDEEEEEETQPAY